MKFNDRRWRSNYWPSVTISVIFLILSAIQDDVFAAPIFGAIPSVAIAGDLATKMAAIGAAKLGTIAAGGLAFKAVSGLLTGGLTQEQINQLTCFVHFMRVGPNAEVVIIYLCISLPPGKDSMEDL